MNLAAFIDFDPRLVEEAVLLATERAGGETAGRFRVERDPVYGLDSPEARESAFGRLHARWFQALGLFDPIEDLLREHPALVTSTSRCAILMAGSRKQEGADLHALSGPPAGTKAPKPPALVIQLLPATLVDAPRLEELLRRELLHVADMLDPAFGYEPTLPEVGEGASRQNLLRDRYRVLWETTIDGRLEGRGLLPVGRRARSLAEFAATFPMLGPDMEDSFRRFFETPRPAHADLLLFATSAGAGTACPVCRFPTASLRQSGAGIDPETVAQIRRETPGWHPALGLCAQCADLYTSRAVTQAYSAR